MLTQLIGTWEVRTLTSKELKNMTLAEAEAKTDSITKDLIAYIHMPKEFRMPDWANDLILKKEQLIQLSKFYLFADHSLCYVNNLYDDCVTRRATDVEQLDWYFAEVDYDKRLGWMHIETMYECRRKLENCESL